MANPKSYVPPHSLDAEKSTLGSLLVDKDSIVKISDFISANDFYHDAHKLIFQAILDLYDKRTPIDMVTLTNILNDRDQLKLIGGATYLAKIANEVPTATHIFQYATIIKEKSVLRKLIMAGDTIKGLGFHEDTEIEDLIDRSEKALFGVSQTFVSDSFVHIKDVLSKTYEKVSDLHDADAKDKYSGISTGFKSLDHILSGFHPSDLVILAARPSMGKTALALNIAQNIARKGHTVGLISLEMSKEQLVERMFCSLLAVDSWKMRTGQLTDDDFSKIGSVMDEMNSMKIFIDDSLGNSIAELKSKARRLKIEHGLDALFIDYLQLMSGGSKSTYQGNRVQEISEISRSLKELARDLHMPIIALSQLSRAVELRPNKMPQLSDLRECVTGDTNVLLADGRQIPIKELVGLQPEVVAVDENGKLFNTLSDKVWEVGEREVFDIHLASGRKISATAKHRLMSYEGWREIKDLSEGDRLALTHHIPEPENPIIWSEKRVALLGQLIGNGNRWHPKGVNKWLRDLGIFNHRSHQKRIPRVAYQFNNEQVAILLRHLWATDGTIYTKKLEKGGGHCIHYATNSKLLAFDVSSLLLRFGIVARIRKNQKGTYRPGYMVVITGANDMRKFLKYVGAFGPRKEQAEKLSEALKGVIANTNVDSLPNKIFNRVRELMKSQGITTRQMCALRSSSYNGMSAFAFSPSRIVMSEYAEILNDDVLKNYCTNDLFWDKIVKINYRGIENVYDLTVPGPACFLANNIVSHNSGSIEQDADVVLMIYREDYYDDDTERKGITDIFVRKHRNGPVGHAELVFKKEQLRFIDIETNRSYDGSPNGPAQF